MARPICKKLRLPEMILSDTSRAVQKLVRSPQFAQARGQAPRIYLTKMAAGQLFDDLYQVAWDMGNLLAAQKAVEIAVVAKVAADNARPRYLGASLYGAALWLDPCAKNNVRLSLED